MALDESRATLNDLLAKPAVVTLVLKQWSAVLPVIEAWWSDFKKFEEDDDFEKAFQDQRMTVRYSKRGLNETLELNARANGQGELRAFEKAPTQEKGAAARWAAKNAPKENFKLDVSVAGVRLRTMPGHFVPTDGGQSRKCELGLHDLSASLLRARQISPQLYNKPESDDRYVFMPLPKQEDQEVFQRLSGLAKEIKAEAPDLYKLVRKYRSQMTRVKLACEHDMGTNFIALAPDSKINPRFRYGIGPTTKVPEVVDGRATGKLVLDVENTRELIAARKVAAVNYKSILARELFTVNEITIAYRKHGGESFKSLFPMFADWDGANFRTFGMNNFGRTNANRHTISDDGVYT